MGFLDGPRPYAFAHRGFAPDGDENSMAAFQRAVDLGYRYLETDVRATADGVALAFHDAKLDRVTDGRGEIEKMTWAQVRKARIRGGEPIPLLADVLGTWPEVRINLDMKSSRSLQPSIDVVRRTASIDRVCVGAFATRRIRAVRAQLGPGLCTSFGPAAVVSLRMTGRAFPRGAACVEVPASVGRLAVTDARFLSSAHRLGLPVIAYTVDVPAHMHRLLDLGVDGLMTDRADLLREVLVERGQWGP